jgi:hypothetical protein
MRLAAFLVGLLAIASASAPPARAQTVAPASLVKQLHQRYLGRDPKDDESRYWVDQLSRGAVADDVHAGVLGSEAYFNRHKRDAAAWIDGAYAMVQNRTPSEAERNAWLVRLTQLGNDRIRWSKEFLTASGASIPSTSPSVPSDSGMAPLADRLVTTTKLLSESVATELPGTRNWLVKVQATNLEATAASYRGVLSDPARDRAGALAAQQNLLRSADSLRGALTSSQVNAPSSGYYLAQAEELIRSIGASLSGGPVAKPPVSPIVNGYDSQTVVRIDQGLEHLAAHARETALLARTAGLRDYEFVRVQNDLDAFAVQTDAVRTKLRTNVARAEVQANLASLRTQGSVVTAGLQRATADARITNSWYHTVQSLDAVLAVAGVSPPFVPSQPPVIQPVDWSSPTQTDWTKTQRVRDAVAAVQAECDALVAAVGPYAFYSFHVQSMQDELRSLRSAMDAVNQTALSGGTAQQLWERVAESNGDYAQAKSYWKKAQATPSLQNLPTLDRLSQALSRLNMAAAGG